MSAQPIQQVGRVRDRSEMEGVDKPGAFTVFNDNSAIFTGNGDLTFRNVSGHFVNYLGQNDPELRRLANNADAAGLAAGLVIQQNPRFAGAGPDSVVPRGDQVQLSGDSLQAMLRPYASDDGLKKLRAALENMTFDGTNSAQTRITGQVKSRGLILPNDPNI